MISQRSPHLNILQCLLDRLSALEYDVQHCAGALVRETVMASLPCVYFKKAGLEQYLASVSSRQHFDEKVLDVLGS